MDWSSSPTAKTLCHLPEKRLEEAVLDAVRVLVLVHEDVLELPLVLVPHLLLLVENAQGEEEQVVEVHRVGGGQAALVVPVDGRDGQGEVPLRLGREVLRVDAVALGAADGRGHRPRLEVLVREAPLPEEVLHQALRVVRVEDGEVPRERPAEGLHVRAQEARADAVEGAHPQEGEGVLLHEAADALLHLAGGLVREGHRQDVVRRNVLLGEEVRDAVGDDPRLARTRPGQDEHRGALVGDGFPLFGVEVVQEGVRHRWGPRFQ